MLDELAGVLDELAGTLDELSSWLDELVSALDDSFESEDLSTACAFDEELSVESAVSSSGNCAIVSTLLQPAKKAIAGIAIAFHLGLMLNSPY